MYQPPNVASGQRAAEECSVSMASLVSFISSGSQGLETVGIGVTIDWNVGIKADKSFLQGP